MDYVRPLEVIIPGVQGRVLGVLSRAEAELTMRTVADLASVSPQQASVVLANLIEMGLVTRRDAGTAALVRLQRDNEAARAILALAGLRDAVLARLKREAHKITPAPTSLVLFGSFARGEAGARSDLDVVVVRPGDARADDDNWTDSLGRWQDMARRIVGNPVNLIELSDGRPTANHARSGQLWRDIAAEGIVLVGKPIRMATAGRRTARSTVDAKDEAF